MLTDYMYQEKREEEDLPALKTTLTHRYDDYIEKHDRGLITAIRNKGTSGGVMVSKLD